MYSIKIPKTLFHGCFFVVNNPFVGFNAANGGGVDGGISIMNRIAEWVFFRGINRRDQTLIISIHRGYQRTVEQKHQESVWKATTAREKGGEPHLCCFCNNHFVGEIPEKQTKQRKKKMTAICSGIMQFVTTMHISCNGISLLYFCCLKCWTFWISGIGKCVILMINLFTIIITHTHIYIFQIAKIFNKLRWHLIFLFYDTIPIIILL